MPHEVIMPALGMAQDSGILVAWLKKPGDPVAEGDALFEVETDKATMEVEAQSAGYLTDVSAREGEDIPVGQVIARISETAEGSEDAPAVPAEAAATPAPAAEIPDGKTVIMPALGMAQDSGLIVAWHKQPGDRVAAEDVLFEVETDKATMEVEAGVDGYVAALLAEAGEEAPVGATIAVISASAPDGPVRRSYTAASRTVSAPITQDRVREPESMVKPARSQRSAAPAPLRTSAAEGRILASPKARRLALEQGLDLARLVEAGHPQPYHVADLEVLRSVAAGAPQTGQAVASLRRTAEAGAEGFADFATWAATEAGLADEGALIAGFAAAGLGRETATVAVERSGRTRAYSVPLGPLSLIAGAREDATPDLLVRDLRETPVTMVDLGPEDVPVLTITGTGGGLSVTLECAASRLSADAALGLLTAFAGRIDDPLRHLL